MTSSETLSVLSPDPIRSLASNRHGFACACQEQKRQQRLGEGQEDSMRDHGKTP
jgi:hypothetical protein